MDTGVCVCVCVCRVGGRVVVCVPNMWFHLCYVALTYFVCVCGGGERGGGRERGGDVCVTYSDTMRLLTILS